MIRVLDIIKTFDIFGRPLNLNFDKKWNTYDTSIGGILTGFMVLFSLIYTGLLFNVMLTHGQNTTSTLEDELNLNELGEI